MLELHRTALRLRRAHPAVGDDTLRWLAAPPPDTAAWLDVRP